MWWNHVDHIIAVSTKHYFISMENFSDPLVNAVVYINVWEQLTFVGIYNNPLTRRVFRPSRR